MDHFEGIVSTLLEADGYWVRRSYKVNVSKEDKKRIGKGTIPRPEIDILALSFKENIVLAIEAKSFLDSSGVKLSDLEEKYDVPQGRYKLFTCDNYREIVFKQLIDDLRSSGMANDGTKVLLGLAAGNIHQGKSDEIEKFMKKDDKGWFFWSPEDIKQKVESLAKRGYENDASIITAKILMRDRE